MRSVGFKFHPVRCHRFHGINRPDGTDRPGLQVSPPARWRGRALI